jgi:hypothetical protein
MINSSFRKTEQMLIKIKEGKQSEINGHLEKVLTVFNNCS